jgi:hypothetical protein
MGKTWELPGVCREPAKKKIEKGLPPGSHPKKHNKKINRVGPDFPP